MRSMFALLLTASILSAGDIEVKKTPVPTGSFAVVKYKLSAGDQVAWKVYPQPIEVEQVITEDYAYLFFNGKPREYSVDATIVNFDRKTLEQKNKSVVIGAKVPPDDEDKDDDTKPTDPLFAKIKAEYDKEISASKKEDIARLAAVYEAIAEQIKDINTAGDLFTIIKSATDARIGGNLKSIRPLFGAELAKILPNDPATILVVEQKRQAAEQLKRFSTLLGGIK